MFVLNLKTFPGVLGPRAIAFARELERAGRAAGVAVAVAPPTPQLETVAGGVRIPVLAQHVDAGLAGPSTGFVPVRSIVAAGARGSLVNHSEHPVAPDAARAAVAELGAVGLSAVVCAPTPRAARNLAAAKPPYVAIEPPELIGGRRAVSTARPAVIGEGVRAVRAVSPRTRVLCGAGIHDRDDVRRALELGAEGVLVASAVALAPRPRRVLQDLLAGFDERPSRP